MPESQQPSLTVVIPTRDRPELLGVCLEHLAREARGPVTLRVLVVDDGSATDLAGVVERAAAAGLPVELLRQEHAGANAARNRGAAEARTEIVAFLDDDQIVEDGWTVAMADRFRHGASAVAGRIVLALDRPPPRWLNNHQLRIALGELDLGPDPKLLPPEMTPFSGNCAVSRPALEQAGGFPINRPVDGFARLNDEIALFMAVRERIGPVWYEPGATTLNQISADRLSRGWFRRRFYSQGACDVLYLEGGRSEPPSFHRELLRAARSLPILAKGVTSRRGTTNAVLWGYYCAGRVAAIRANRRRRPS